MTLESTASTVRYVGNGATTEFGFPFRVWSAEQVAVYVGDGEQEEEVSSSCTITVTDTGGSVTFAEAPAEGVVIVIQRSMPYTQEDNYENGTSFNAEEVEDRFDQDAAERQDLRRDIDRAVTVPKTSTLSGTDLLSDIYQARDDAQAAVEQIGGAEFVTQARNDVVEAMEAAGEVTGATRIASASGGSTLRSLSDRCADWVNLKDFGAAGDGSTNDTAAWNKFQTACASGGVGYIPPGDYLVNGELLKFESGCIGNGVFKDAYNSPVKAQGGTIEDVGGYWRQVSRNPTQQNFLHPASDGVSEDNLDNNYERTLIQHQVAYSANNEAGRTVCGPIIKTQSIVEYNQPESGQNYSFARVIGAYHEGIGKGLYNHQSDAGGTGGFTVFGATAHNRFAGHFGMTAVTGQVWNASEAENPNIELYQIKDANNNVFGSSSFNISTAQYVTDAGGNKILRSANAATYGTGYGASKVCGGYFPVHPRSRFSNGGYYIGIETGLSSEADEIDALPYTNNDSHSFASWICGYHCSAGSNKCPATEGILIDGSASANHAFWNGIVIGASSMKINGQAGYPRTVGLNMASWNSSGNYGDIAIKLGYANRQLWFNVGAKIRSSVTRLLYEGGDTTFSICTDTANNGAEPALQLSKGDVTSNTLTLTHYFVATTNGSNVELDAKQGYITFKTKRNSNAESFVLSDLSFRPDTTAAVDLGADNHRWKNIYNQGGVVTSSDARLKQDISSFSDDVLDAWASVEWRRFRFRSAVETKGEAARVHAGLIAQEVQAAFANRGLDAARFGLFCHATWDDEYEDVKTKVSDAETDDCGRVVKPAQYTFERRLVRPAGDEYSIRYTEALCMEVALLRRELARIKAQLELG